MRYLKEHPSCGLLYKVNGHLRVEAYSDTDWAGLPSNRKSTTRYCTFLGGNLFSWKSKKQIVVARSSVEVEYRVMAHISCELMWIKHLLE